MRGEIVRGSEGAVRVSRVSRDGGRGGGERGGGISGERSLAICLDVEEKTIDGFNYG